MKNLIFLLFLIPVLLQAQTVVVTTLSGGMNPTFTSPTVTDTAKIRVIRFSDGTIVHTSSDVGQDTSLADKGDANVFRNNNTFRGNITVNGSTIGNNLKYRYVIGANGKFQTIAAAITWLKSNMAAPTELLLDGGTFTIADSIGIELPYVLSIRGLAFDITKIAATTGLTGKPMFKLRSNVNFERIYFDGSTLASYGTQANENFIDITKAGLYSEFKDCEISRFRTGINLTGASSIFVFNAILDSCYRGVEVNSTGAAIIDCEVLTVQSCAVGINLKKATGGQFKIFNIVFHNSAVDTSINYIGVNYTYANYPTISGCSWNNLGSFLKGFDMSLATGRDANIFIRTNAGYEDKSPHAKVNLSGASATQTFAINTWQKLRFTNTSNYTCKFTIASDSITYQSKNGADLMMWLSAGLQTTSQSASILVGVVKNHVTTTIYGEIPVTLDQNGRTFNMSTNVYISDAKQGDVFSIWIKAVGVAEEIQVIALDWLIRAQ